MSVEVKLTVKFSFPNGSPKPVMGEIADFVKSLDADLGEMIATYRIAEEKAIYIKFKSEDAMHHCLMQNNDQLPFTYADGKVVEVCMSPAGDNVLYIKVYDLPHEVSDSDVALVLGEYGVVKRVVREKFPASLLPDMFSGVRGVHMVVKKEIPSSLRFLNKKGNIFYEGNKNLCFLCKMDGHKMNICPERKKRKQPKRREDNGGGIISYANVVTEVVEENLNNETEATMEVLEEEVVDMVETSPDVAKEADQMEEASGAKKPPVFKYPSDAYYYYKFGIVDYTENERKKHEEEAKRIGIYKENHRVEDMEERAREKTETKLKSPPRKSKKNS